jgi:hypothetical protein
MFVSVPKEERCWKSTYPMPYFLHKLLGNSVILDSNKAMLDERVDKFLGCESLLLKCSMKEETKVHQGKLER